MEENNNSIISNKKIDSSNNNIISIEKFLYLQLLYIIPIIGFIIAIIFAFSSKNKTIKNHAQGTLIALVIATIFIIIRLILKNN